MVEEAMRGAAFKFLTAFQILELSERAFSTYHHL